MTTTTENINRIENYVLYFENSDCMKVKMIGKE